MDRTVEAARKLVNDWGSRAGYETLTGAYAPGSVAEAYDVQAAVQQLHVEKRGAVAGRKIALASRAMQQMIGIDSPISGAILAGDIAQSPAEIRADDFVRLGVEFELAVELNADVAPQGRAHTPGSALDLIAAVRPAFELIEDRNADYAQLDPLTLIADNAWCGGVVLGPELPDWRNLDLGNIPTVVRQAGEADENANTGAADPLGSLAWVLNHFAQRGVALARGELVITGSAVRTRFPVPGDRLAYEMAGASVEIAVI